MSVRERNVKICSNKVGRSCQEEKTASLAMSDDVSNPLCFHKLAIYPSTATNPPIYDIRLIVDVTHDLISFSYCLRSLFVKSAYGLLSSLDSETRTKSNKVKRNSGFGSMRFSTFPMLPHVDCPSFTKHDAHSRVTTTSLKPIIKMKHSTCYLG